MQPKPTPKGLFGRSGGSSARRSPVRRAFSAATPVAAQGRRHGLAATIHPARRIRAIDGLSHRIDAAGETIGSSTIALGAGPIMVWTGCAAHHRMRWRRRGTIRERARLPGRNRIRRCRRLKRPSQAQKNLNRVIVIGSNRVMPPSKAAGLAQLSRGSSTLVGSDHYRSRSQFASIGQMQVPGAPASNPQRVARDGKGA